MKKLVGLLLWVALCSSCTTTQSEKKKIAVVRNSEDTTIILLDNFAGSYYKGNYVWGLAMTIAWQELTNTILHENLKLNTADTHALQIVASFNYTNSSKKDIDDLSYYVKAGYGQKTIDTINKESRKKFPTKTFNDLKIQLAPTDIISYAYFLKEVKYKESLYKRDVKFLGKSVKGFYAAAGKQKKAIQVISYDNDDRFIISLKLSDEGDELLFAKGYNMKKPQIVLDAITKKNSKEHLQEQDFFEAPNLHLNFHRVYSEIAGNFLANKNFSDYFIGHMFENIKLDIDEKGFRIENEAVITLFKSFAPQVSKKKPRHFKLNKPYWVIMKKSNSKNPYLILGIHNTELMENANGPCVKAML